MRHLNYLKSSDDVDRAERDEDREFRDPTDPHSKYLLTGQGDKKWGRDEEIRQGSSLAESASVHVRDDEQRKSHHRCQPVEAIESPKKKVLSLRRSYIQEKIFLKARATYRKFWGKLVFGCFSMFGSKSTRTNFFAEKCLLMPLKCF